MKTKKTVKKTTKTAKKTGTKQIFSSIILDESGSMDCCRTQTIEGFNEYIKGLTGQKDDFRVTLTKFHSGATTVIHDAVKVKDIPMLTLNDYIPSDLTPLYDAVGRTIKALEDKVGTKQLVGTGVIVTIITDGAENASKEFTKQQVFDKIEQCKKNGWTFAFLGANQDAWAGSQALGILSNNVQYNQANTSQAFRTLSTAHSTYAGTITKGCAVVMCCDIFTEKDKEDLKAPTK